jgi:hypothetical protein
MSKVKVNAEGKARPIWIKVKGEKVEVQCTALIQSMKKLEMTLFTFIKYTGK